MNSSYNKANKLGCTDNKKISYNDEYYSACNRNINIFCCFGVVMLLSMDYLF